MNTQFEWQNQLTQTSDLFNLTHRQNPYQALPVRARLDLEAMAMKVYFAFPKAPALLEPHHQII